MKCPICDNSPIDHYVEPIDYFICHRCGEVYVYDKDNTITALKGVMAEEYSKAFRFYHSSKKALGM